MNKKVTVDICQIEGKSKVFLAIDQFLNTPSEELTGEWVSLEPSNARIIAQWLLDEAAKVEIYNNAPTITALSG